MEDYHVHSDVSPDGKDSMERMCEAALKAGLREIAFTDHYECFMGGVRSPHFHESYLKLYFQKLSACREQYAGRLTIRAGLELGQSHLGKEEVKKVLSYPFDFILGSVHKLGNVDLSWISFTPKNAGILARTYFAILEELAAEGEYDCLGHLDYVKKHMLRCGCPFVWEDYEEEYRRILNHVVRRGKGIEVNTAGLGTFMEETMPEEPILSLYKELGGEIVTLGSDAHRAERVGYGFSEAKDRLSRAGFARTATFASHQVGWEGKA